MARLTNKPINTIYAGPACEKMTYKDEGLMVAALLPGTIVSKVGSDLVALTSANSIAGQKPLVLDIQTFTGKQILNPATIGDTNSAFELQADKLYYAQVLTAQAITKGMPLKVSATNGVLDIGDPATDTIVARAAETYTTTAQELVLVENYYA